jgi:hypothetical protein
LPRRLARRPYAPERPPPGRHRTSLSTPSMLFHTDSPEGLVTSA